ncbi:PKD domain-containing protein, partial [Candidatus Amoebophilus asiaticus]|nr:PKD domain-containing protein [Candidatus Amoebophilus asiaticus]
MRNTLFLTSFYVFISIFCFSQNNKKSWCGTHQSVHTFLPHSGSNLNASYSKQSDISIVKKYHLLIVVVDSSVYGVSGADIDSMIKRTNEYFAPWDFEFCYSTEFIDDSMLTLWDINNPYGSYTHAKYRHDQINVIIKDWPTLGYSGNPIKIDYSVVAGNNAVGGIVLAHELGHDFQLGHVSDPNNIMYSSIGSSNPSFDSLQAFVMDYYANGEYRPYNLTSYPGWRAFGKIVCPWSGIPYVRFYTNIQGGCSPLTVNFFDDSSFEPTSWLWNFGDGDTSMQQNPSHTYTSAGTYTVSLTCSNAFGARTETKINYIVTYDNPVTLPIIENFEDTLFPPVNWHRQHPELKWNRKLTWERDTNPSGSNNGLATASVYDFLGWNPFGELDAIISPLYNFQNVIVPYMSFDVAYNWYNWNIPDTFKVYYSNDCGSTHNLIYKKGGIDLITTPDTIDFRVPFVPKNTYEWRTDTINLNALIGKTSVIFKFEFVHGRRGNYLYLDNI